VPTEVPNSRYMIYDTKFEPLVYVPKQDVFNNLDLILALVAKTGQLNSMTAEADRLKDNIKRRKILIKRWEDTKTNLEKIDEVSKAIQDDTQKLSQLKEQIKQIKDKYLTVEFEPFLLIEKYTQSEKRVAEGETETQHEKEAPDEYIMRMTLNRELDIFGILTNVVGVCRAYFLEHVKTTAVKKKFNIVNLQIEFKEKLLFKCIDKIEINIDVTRYLGMIDGTKVEVASTGRDMISKFLFPFTVNFSFKNALLRKDVQKTLVNQLDVIRTMKFEVASAFAI